MRHVSLSFVAVILAAFVASPVKAVDDNVIVVPIGVSLTNDVASTANTLDDNVSFQDADDLLDVELKLRAMRQLQARGFFIPPQLADKYLQEQQRLAEAMQSAAMQDMESIEVWSKAAADTAKAEKETVEKVMRTWLMKKAIAQIKSATKESESGSFDKDGWALLVRKQQEDYLRFARDEKSKAAAVALFLEEYLIDKQRGSKVTDGWRESMRQTYRGIVKDHNKLADGIVRLERERLQSHAALESMKLVGKWTKRIETLNKLSEGPVGYFQEEAEDKIVELLKAKYPDADIDNAKTAFDVARDIFGTAQESWQTVNNLSEDVNLKAFPETVALAQKCAVLGGAFKSTLTAAKKIPALEALGPAIDVMDFYVESINLIPTVTQKLGEMFAKAEQDVVGDRGRWSAVYQATGAADLYKSEAMSGCGLQIAYAGNDPNRFYMLVPADVDSKGFVALSREEYDRLAAAVAAERIITAPSEASAGIASSVWAAVMGDTTLSPLSADANKTYLEDLKKKASLVPFKEKDLISLARGQAVEHGGRQRTGEDLLLRADTALASLADELAVREALPEYSHALKKKWWEFRELVRRHAVALTPKQIVRLFGGYVNGGPGAAERTLAKLARERAARRLGIPKAGVPLVTIPSLDPELFDAVKAGSTADIVATVIVSDLAPGRQVPADIIWTFPTWAKDQGKVDRVSLGNGVHEFKHHLSVPKRGADNEFIVKVAVEFPPDETHDQPIADIVGEGRFQKLKTKPVQFEFINVNYKDVAKRDGNGNLTGEQVRVICGEMKNAGETGVNNPIINLKDALEPEGKFPAKVGLSDICLLPAGATAPFQMMAKAGGPTNFEFFVENINRDRAPLPEGKLEFADTHFGVMWPSNGAETVVQMEARLKNVSSEPTNGGSEDIVVTFYDESGKVVGVGTAQANSPGDSIAPGQLGGHFSMNMHLIGDTFSAYRLTAQAGEKHFVTEYRECGKIHVGIKDIAGQGLEVNGVELQLELTNNSKIQLWPGWGGMRYLSAYAQENGAPVPPGGTRKLPDPFRSKHKASAAGFFPHDPNFLPKFE